MSVRACRVSTLQRFDKLHKLLYEVHSIDGFPSPKLNLVKEARPPSPQNYRQPFSSCQRLCRDTAHAEAKCRRAYPTPIPGSCQMVALTLGLLRAGEAGRLCSSDGGRGERQGDPTISVTGLTKSTEPHVRRLPRTPQRDGFDDLQKPPTKEDERWLGSLLEPLARRPWVSGFLGWHWAVLAWVLARTDALCGRPLALRLLHPRGVEGELRGVMIAHPTHRSCPFLLLQNNKFGSLVPYVKALHGIAWATRTAETRYTLPLIKRWPAWGTRKSEDYIQPCKSHFPFGSET